MANKIDLSYLEIRSQTLSILIDLCFLTPNVGRAEAEIYRVIAHGIFCADNGDAIIAPRRSMLQRCFRMLDHVFIRLLLVECDAGGVLQCSTGRGNR